MDPIHLSIKIIMLMIMYFTNWSWPMSPGTHIIRTQKVVLIKTCWTPEQLYQNKNNIFVFFHLKFKVHVHQQQQQLQREHLSVLVLHLPSGHPRLETGENWWGWDLDLIQLKTFQAGLNNILLVVSGEHLPDKSWLIKSLILCTMNEHFHLFDRST